MKDIDLINELAKKNLKEEEVYIFPVRLCDNELDRDGEAFSDDALLELKALAVGIPTLKNHSGNAEDLSARTFKTEVITDSSRKNFLGKDYKYLKAYCYIPKTHEHAKEIADIEAGILKEASISCSVGKKLCSVCGKTAGECDHKKGESYRGIPCAHILENPKDAYEWSFVAVPAQKKAGVVKKSYAASCSDEKKEEKSTEERLTEIGRRYLEECRRAFCETVNKNLPYKNAKAFIAFSERLEPEELRELADIFEKNATCFCSQFEEKTGAHEEYKI